MAKTQALAVILAAGEGTRMRSSTPKVLHQVAGKTMLSHVLDATRKAGFSDRAVVIGAGADKVRAFLSDDAGDTAIHVQKERLGTGHAALAAQRSIKAGADHVVVMFGDTPLVSAAALKKMRQRLARGADMVVSGFRPDDPHGYGRLIMKGKQLLAIREEVAASAEERAIGLCNGGIMGFRGDLVLRILKKIGNDNPKGEFFLTDAVEIANAMGRKVAVIEVPADEILGVNSRADLALAEAAFQQRARAEAMTSGVTMIAPETVWLSHDTRLGRDVVIEPNVFFGPGVIVGDRATVRANSHLEGAKVGPAATVGPFARLRPGAVVNDGAKVGNFVEIKNANIGAGAKVSHLTYVGDADVGAAANLGAGTITCNYDGFSKFRTVIGEGAFVGSNSSLVAPVTIGDGAYVASGSVVTQNVPADAMALGRTRQVTKDDWARKFRDKQNVARKRDRKKTST